MSSECTSYRFQCNCHTNAFYQTEFKNVIISAYDYDKNISVSYDDVSLSSSETDTEIFSTYAITTADGDKSGNCCVCNIDNSKCNDYSFKNCTGYYSGKSICNPFGYYSNYNDSSPAGTTKIRCWSNSVFIVESYGCIDIPMIKCDSYNGSTCTQVTRPEYCASYSGKNAPHDESYKYKCPGYRNQNNSSNINNIPQKDGIISAEYIVQLQNALKNEIEYRKQHIFYSYDHELMSNYNESTITNTDIIEDYQINGINGINGIQNYIANLYVAINLLSGDQKPIGDNNIAITDPDKTVNESTIVSADALKYYDDIMISIGKDCICYRDCNGYNNRYIIWCGCNYNIGHCNPGYGGGCSENQGGGNVHCMAF